MSSNSGKPCKTSRCSITIAVFMWQLGETAVAYAKSHIKAELKTSKTNPEL